MMDSVELIAVYQVATKMLILLAHLFIFGVALSYLIRNYATDSFLMTIGSFVSLLSVVFGSVAFSFLLQSRGPEDIHAFFLINGFIAFLGKLTFGVGLLICINRAVRNN